MKILEYNPNFGTFSAGFETFSQNKVVEVVKLSKNAEYGYNRIHKHWFLANFHGIEAYEPQNSYDLAILNPEFGEKVGRRGKDNFYFTDFQACLNFVRREMPKFVIFTTDIYTIPLLNTAKDYVRDGFGQLSKDIIISELQKMGYDAYLVALDEANYGIPMHKSVALYIATPKDFNMTYPKGLFNMSGRGKYNKFRTIADAISDLGHLGEWVPYKTEPQNVYQKRIRQGMDRTTWNFLSKSTPKGQRDTIAKIKQGSNAKKTDVVKQNAGYNRPKWNSICSSLDERFYLVSSRCDSVHPIENRPFTIREGMRIMGLPDNLSFDLKTPKKDIAAMLLKSVAPAIGEVSAIALRAIE